jgi:hypothetical protein
MARPVNEVKNVYPSLGIPEPLWETTLKYVAKLSVEKGFDFPPAAVVIAALALYLKKQGYKLSSEKYLNHIPEKPE